MAVAGLSVNPELSLAHLENHVNFNFVNSKIDLLRNLFDKCSCGCVPCRKAPKNEDPVYLNHNGMLERFKFKGDPLESHVRSINRIEYFVKETFKNVDGSSREKVYRKVQEKANMNFDEAVRLKKSVTLGKIREIERAIEETAKEENLCPSPVHTPLPTTVSTPFSSPRKNNRKTQALQPKQGSSDSSAKSCEANESEIQVNK